MIEGSKKFDYLSGKYDQNMKIGDQMPSFAVKDQDGRTVKSDELIGRGR